ncbi:hypothetical protein JCM24511_07949 [Saitozyma sp. JCM 24511]|nr:hypothetical protein JCM24511_07949 [Saitozyma sp. JCM 24511]
MPYMKMKGQLEDAVKGMGFERCVILQPGMLLGHREQGRFPENILQHVFRGLRAVGVNFSVEGTDVGECIAQLAANPPEGAVTVVSNSQIIDLAKKWRGGEPGDYECSVTKGVWSPITKM